MDAVGSVLNEATGAGGGMGVVWHRSESRLLQDGWQKEAVDMAAAIADSDDSFFDVVEEVEEVEEESEEQGDTVIEGEGQGQSIDDEIIITEQGLKYAVSLQDAQKTGFYCDQRDNRLLVRSLIRPGDHVLDICTYTGGFALNAAAGGAERVVV